MKCRSRLISLLFLASCVIVILPGCLIKRNVRPTPTDNVRYIPTANAVEITGINSIAILPLADYSHQQTFIRSVEWGGNTKIIEEITDHFVKAGVTVAIQEDVNGTLIKQGLIKPLEAQKGNNISIQGELADPAHHEVMKNMIRQLYMESNRSEPALQGVTSAMAPAMVKTLGETLGVDALIRGRIIEYGLKRKNSLNPLHGIARFVIAGVSDLALGFASSKHYDEGLPSAWDGIPGSTETATVQIRLYLQDTATGKLLWSNRAEVEAYSGAALSYGPKYRKDMFDKATKEAVAIMMKDLFGRPPKPDQKTLGTYSTTIEP